MLTWAENIAKQIIDRRPDKDEYVCAAGISPSGSVHIGNFRDLATPLFVVKALKKRGKKGGKMKNVRTHVFLFVRDVNIWQKKEQKLRGSIYK